MSKYFRRSNRSARAKSGPTVIRVHDRTPPDVEDLSAWAHGFNAGFSERLRVIPEYHATSSKKVQSWDKGYLAGKREAARWRHFDSWRPNGLRGIVPDEEVAVVADDLPSKDDATHPPKDCTLED